MDLSEDGLKFMQQHSASHSCDKWKWRYRMLSVVIDQVDEAEASRFLNFNKRRGTYSVPLQ